MHEIPALGGGRGIVPQPGLRTLAVFRGYPTDSLSPLSASSQTS